MDIEQLEVTVGELADGYHDRGEEGVVGYGGELDIRPPFQREFVYGDRDRDAVVETIFAGFPLNTMYWSDRGEGTSPRYEIIDGQQRTISAALYANNKFAVGGSQFHSLTADKRSEFRGYRLSVYVCRGTESERLAWFRVINIAGKPLTDQELRNAAYAGPWLADAKGWFSRTGGPAHALAGGYMSRKAIRQEYLETAIKWAAGDGTDLAIREYMSRHQHDPNAGPLWRHFQAVIEWAAARFPEKRPTLTRKVGEGWGDLHRGHGSDPFDADTDERRIAALLEDEDVTSQPGIYRYIVTGDERHLNLRQFTAAQRQRAYERQDGKCVNCGKGFKIDDMHGDHFKPWSEGGKTIDDNCQMLCRDCNLRKGAH